MSRLGAKQALAWQRRRIGDLGKFSNASSDDPTRPPPHPPRDPLESSPLLSYVVDAAARVERAYGWARRSHVGQMVHPKTPSHQENMWAELDTDLDVTATVLDDVHATMEYNVRASPTADAAAASPEHLPDPSRANQKERQLVPTEEAADDDTKEAGWLLWYRLLTGKRYWRTLEQQTLDELFKVQPDFTEAKLVRDMEQVLLPRFLEAFWARDYERLRAICTPSCYHLDVCPQLSAFDGLRSNCRFIVASNAAVYERLVVLDDSEFASPDGLRESAPPPQPVLFVRVTARVVNSWTALHPSAAHHRPASAFGDPDAPEVWMCVLGVIPLHHGRWRLANFRYCLEQISS